MNYSVRRSVSHTVTHYFTHSVTHSVSHTLSHTLIHSLSHTLSHTLIHSLSHTLSHTLIHSLSHTLPQLTWLLARPTGSEAPLVARPTATPSTPHHTTLTTHTVVVVILNKWEWVSDEWVSEWVGGQAGGGRIKWMMFFYKKESVVCTIW
jgi:hypothetical protein